MIAGAETMSWRGKYTGWYKVAKEIMPKLLPDLGDTEIMENVTPEDQFADLAHETIFARPLLEAVGDGVVP